MSRNYHFEIDVVKYSTEHVEAIADVLLEVISDCDVVCEDIIKASDSIILCGGESAEEFSEKILAKLRKIDSKVEMQTRFFCYDNIPMEEWSSEEERVVLAKKLPEE